MKLNTFIFIHVSKQFYIQVVFQLETAVTATFFVVKPVSTHDLE